MLKTKFLLTVVMIFIITCAKAQPPYAVNSPDDPSLEARLVINAPLQEIIFNDYSPNGVHANANMLKTCNNLAAMFVHDAYWQYRYMAENSIGLCQLRDMHGPDVDDFFITDHEMGDINFICNTFLQDYAQQQSDYENLFVMQNFVISYFSMAKSVRYTKMEIFADMTGYQDPTDFLVNNPYVSPYPAGNRTVDGLGMAEALRKIGDIYNDISGEMFPEDCFYHGPAAPKADVKRDGQQMAGGVNCFPSPFSNKTQISYSISKAGNIDLQVYDIDGKAIKNLKKGNSVSGNFITTWDGTDNENKNVSDGMYFIVLQSSDTRQVIKVLISR